MRYAIALLLPAVALTFGTSCKTSAGTPSTQLQLESEPKATLGSAAGPRVAISDYSQGSARGEIWIATLDPASSSLSVQLVQRPAFLKDFAKLPSGSIAINGGFYDANGALGLIIAGGKLENPLRKDGGSGVFVVDSLTGKAAIVHRDDYKTGGGVDHALQSIDRLVHDGNNLVAPGASAPRDARSAIAIDGMGTVYFVTVYDNRAIASRAGGLVRLNQSSTSTGPTLWELGEFLSRSTVDGGLEAQWALNLDGGYSTSIHFVDDGVKRGVVGYRGTINAVVAQPR